MDPASAANTADFRVSHTEICLAVDFNTKQVFGTVQLSVVPLSHSSHLILDVLKLQLFKLSVHASNKTTTPKFSTQPFASFGEKLVVELDEILKEAFTIEIHYAASVGPALCWLEPPQTAGKMHPFLFTQGQACLNRSLLPCQDSPGARATWSATMVLPKPYIIVMSAPIQNSFPEGATVPTGSDVASIKHATLYADTEASTSLPQVLTANHHSFHFVMANEVPIYLLAFAAGDLQSARVGPRSRVWTEPCLLDKAAWEFGHGNITEKYLQAAEHLFGPYLWGVYDMVILGPSFPFGGMENPTATFLNPMLLAGDQSLTDTVAHEEAHSWFGNLVGPTSWTDFWVNEGFTMFAQRAIEVAVHGEAFAALETISGRELLRATVRDYGADSSLTRLRVPLEKGTDPDETYNDTAYEKGFAFVSYLLECVKASAVHGGQSAEAGRASFFQWLTAYCAAFSFKSIRVTQIFEHFFSFFPHLRGDWTAQSWEAEEQAAAPAYWAQPGALPEDIDASGTLPAWPADGVIVGACGKCGLAYRPGLEFAMWMHRPGWPVYYPDLSAAEVLTQPALALALAWLDAAAVQGTPLNPPNGAGVFESMPTYQKCFLLDVLVQKAEAQASAEGPVNAVLLAGVDAAYALSTSTNAELRLRWSLLVAATAFVPGLPSVAGFLRMTGKLKYVTPVFRALAGRAATQAFAAHVYAEVRPSYHPASQSRVDGVFAKAGLPLSLPVV